MSILISCSSFSARSGRDAWLNWEADSVCEQAWSTFGYQGYLEFGIRRTRRATAFRRRRIIAEEAISESGDVLSAA